MHDEGAVTRPQLAEQWRGLLETATLIPSPHNVQPWRFRLLDESHAQIHIEKRRTLPDEDKLGSFMVLTMGLLAESLSLVAAHDGFLASVVPVQDLNAFSAHALRRCPEPYLHFADLTLRPAPELQPAVALDLFARRQTSRLPYRDEPVADVDGDALSALAASYGHAYTQTTDRARIERLLALNTQAVFEDLNHPPFRNEMRCWLRYTEEQSLRLRDGLDARCMNVHPFELWLAFHLSPLLLWVPTRPWFARRYRAQIGPVATMGFLSGAFWDPHDAFPAGRFLLRFWLECARLGYCFQPYANLVTNRPTAEKVEGELGARNIWLVFRIGRSPEAPRSRRRSLEELLLD